MPEFAGECACGKISFFFFGANDPRRCHCPACGDTFDLDGNRRWDLEGIQIQGETCPGGTNYHYFDPHLGRQINGRADRAYEMEKQGLREYTPNPELQKHRQEAEYVYKNAGPKERDAAKAAARKELKTAEVKRRDEILTERFDKVARKIDGA